MKKIYSLLFLLISLVNFAQIKGTVSDEKGNPLPFVSISVENTYKGTSSNEQGIYELNIQKPGKQVLVFKLLGFKTKRETVTIKDFPFLLNVSLSEENVTLNEVIINKGNNPAIAIIKSAIASKKENSEKLARFTADFYSRGLFKIKDLPKKILGMKVDLGDMASNLDSTGSGILYLSETISKITYEKPNNLKETIIASRISGNNNGYSYNTAKNSTYDFYDNTLEFGINMISPLANNAFNYYKYKLEGTFFDENNQQINKIKVIPKRDKEPVFEGYIYIVDDSFAIYAVDLDIKGYRMKNELTEVMTLKQNFSYNSKTKIWSKNIQSLAFNAGAFGTKFSGKFNYVYTNYEFPSSFEKKTFGNEILNFEGNANKKEDTFWKTIRPIPLTFEESNDYIKKDSLQTIRKSKKYLDSVDAKNNKFKISNLLMGYDYKNTFEKHSFKYNGLLDISSLSFNTVQGYSLSSGFSYTNWNDEIGRRTTISSTFNYGFSEERLRVSGEFKHQFNNQNYSNITVSGGTKVNQFNNNIPISTFINSSSTLFFRNNFMKLYNKEFLEMGYSRNIANGFYLDGKLEYSQRKPLFNTTNYSYFKKNDLFFSNNPLDPNDFTNSGFDAHHLTKFTLNARINFGNKYLSRPDGRFNIRNENYPTLYLSYEKGFAATAKKYEFDHLKARLYYDYTLGNKGSIATNIIGGKFFKAENISFIDYKHFNGNQTHIGQSARYLNVFNLLPYYTNSTNDAYFEVHSEYNDKGFVMNKIPLFNLLKSNLILGFHNLAVPNTKPYNEYTVGLDNLGFGKFKIFRLDYIRSYQNGFRADGIIFGLKILNVLE